MSQRLFNTNWFFYLLLLQAGSLWSTVRSVTVRTPPSNPSTVEAQAKFFQDFFSVQLSPYKMEFGHVCEDPDTWEQRYERKDFKNHRDMGKVRWGDKKGGYGEHYWDLNHAGHAGNHGNDGYDGDDGSYHEPSNSDPYDDHSGSPNYSNDDYDPEKSNYEESGRAKRAHPKVNIERRPQKTDRDTYEEVPKLQRKTNRNKEQHKEKVAPQVEEDTEEEEEKVYEKPTPRRQQYRKQEESPPGKEKNQVVLVVNHKDGTEKQPSQYSAKKSELPQYVSSKKSELPQYVPYEGGAGIRQHQPELSVAKPAPRLFLEPSTGHVVDRATGQAYILQPVVINNYN